METNAETGAVARAGRREWQGLAVLALPTILLSIDITVLYLALPQLSVDLGPSSVQQLWILDIYAFLIAGLLLTMGTLGDRIGRRRLLLMGAAAFGVASAVAAYSNSPEMLIAARALMGIAGATLMPSTLALISNMFKDPKQMGMAIGVWMSCFMAGSAIGPLVGGVMLNHFWWGSVFLLGVPVMLLLLVVGPVLLPEYRDPEAGRPDLISVALSLAGMLSLIYGLKELARAGLEPVPVLALLAGVAIGAAFVVRQRRLADPLLDMSLFGNRSFSVSLGSMLVAIVAVAGLMLFVTQYLQTIEGLSPLKAGLWLLPAVASMTVGSMLAPAIANKVRPAYLIATGLAISVLGLVLLAQLDSGVGGLVVAHALIGFGVSPLMALGTNLVIGSAPEEKAGSAASMSETSGEIGGALGVALLGSLGTAVYRDEISLPAGIPAEAADGARDTLAGAAAAASRLPGLSTEILAPAQAAFVQAMNTVAVVSAVVVAVVAVLVVVLLKHVPPTGTAEADADADAGTEGPASPADTATDVPAVDTH